MELVEHDPRCSTENPMFDEVEQPGIGTYLMPGSPLDFSDVGRLPPRRAPVLGEHTDEVLAEVLALTDAEIGRLHAAASSPGRSSELSRSGGGVRARNTPDRIRTCDLYVIASRSISLTGSLVSK